MNLIAALVFAQLSAAGPKPTPVVLSFPEPGLDDTASYQGYQTRFFRDAAGNTVQIYIDRRSGRLVHLWADSENSSAGLTVRDAAQRLPAELKWVGATADVSRTGRHRTLAYELEAAAPRVHLGWFLLGSMRVERDFQYWGKHREPFAAEPFVLEEMRALLMALERLETAEQRSHLAQLRAADLPTLRSRLRPTITITHSGGTSAARIVQPSLDARDTMTIVVRVDPARVTLSRQGDSISLAARTGDRVPLSVSVSTTGRALTPLAREEIFTREFLDFLAASKRAAATSGAPDSVQTRARWLERQVRGVELLSSREKLMAGLPAYATYFGRDMLVSALMMRPIWRAEMSAFVVASVLRKLSASGQVSHEEALGGQAVREAAAEYAALIARADSASSEPSARTLRARARDVLRDHRRVRENYHMVDDELQLPVLAARWLADPNVSTTRKRAFLMDSTDGSGPRVRRLLTELSLVARMTGPYAADPTVSNLIAFAPRDTGWSSSSWRDSGAGYAGGRYAMDVNAIWAPHALESIGTILASMRAISISDAFIAETVRAIDATSPLNDWVRDTTALRRAIDRWFSASRHFRVQLAPDEVRRRVSARLAALPEPERDHWNRVLMAQTAGRDSLDFLALSLDAEGRPIAVVNSDPATALFLGGHQSTAEVLRAVDTFVRPYPVGLFIGGVGSVVANDAYAPPAVWAAFERDRYHSPRVVWGREINLFLAGIAERIATARNREAAARMRAALDEVLRAAESSGFQSELWSYEVRDGRVVPVRYGTGSDVQLWSTTDLAVQFALSKLKR